MTGKTVSNAATSPLYLDELSIGQQFVSGSHSIDREQIIAFASAFDPQPFHLDDVAARNSVFGGLAASGWHTVAITMRLLVAEQYFADGIIGAGAEISWPRPTRPGDVLTVTSTVVEITPSRSKPERGIVLIRNETRNQRDEVVQLMHSKLSMSRRPGSGVST